VLVCIGGGWLAVGVNDGGYQGNHLLSFGGVDGGQMNVKITLHAECKDEEVMARLGRYTIELDSVTAIEQPIDDDERAVRYEGDEMLEARLDTEKVLLIRCEKKCYIFAPSAARIISICKE
jgi:hypothetical protein